MIGNEMSTGIHTSGRFRRSILFVLIIFILAGICSRFFFQLMFIQGNSMLPAYHHLQIVILDKITKQYDPGDVIAFKCEGLSSVLVKRIAAGPGDIAVIQGGTLYVNGGKSIVFSEECIFSYSGILEQMTVLGDGEYLTIGDNIQESKDSRYPEIGLISEENIIGKIL